jgi:hypothetical protein
LGKIRGLVYTPGHIFPHPVCRFRAMIPCKGGFLCICRIVQSVTYVRSILSRGSNPPPATNLIIGL